MGFQPSVSQNLKFDFGPFRASKMLAWPLTVPQPKIPTLLPPTITLHSLNNFLFIIENSQHFTMKEKIKKSWTKRYEKQENIRRSLFCMCIHKSVHRIKTRAQFNLHWILNYWGLCLLVCSWNCDEINLWIVDREYQECLRYADYFLWKEGLEFEGMMGFCGSWVKFK